METRSRFFIMDDLKDRAQRMKVLWAKGRGMYASFFAELKDVRGIVGDDGLADWCFDELRIGLSVIRDMTAVLQKADADRERQDLAEASRIARDRRRAERDAERARRESQAESKRLAEEERRAAEEQANLAATAQKKAQEKADKRAAARAARASARATDPSTDESQSPPDKKLSKPPRDKWNISAIEAIKRVPAFVGIAEQLKYLLIKEEMITPPKSDSQWGHLTKIAIGNGILVPTGEIRKDSHGLLKTVYRVGSIPSIADPVASPTLVEAEQSEIVAAVPSLDALASEIRDIFANKINRSYALTEEARLLWIEGTIELATKLREARNIQSGNGGFSVWLDLNDITISQDDRAALLNMADFPSETRAALERTERRSWRLIWREEINPRVRNAANTRIPDEPQSAAIH